MKDKKKDMMEEHRKKAKLDVLMDLKKMAQDMMGEGLTEKMKKVTVASSSSEGLEEGLDKAKELLSPKLSQDLPDSNEASEMDEAEYEEDEECNTPEEIDAKIAELQAKKEQLMRS